MSDLSGFNLTTNSTEKLRSIAEQLLAVLNEDHSPAKANKKVVRRASVVQQRKEQMQQIIESKFNKKYYR